MISILLIDDHSLFREAVGRLLSRESDLQIVGECGTVDEAIAVLKTTHVDIVLLDIDLGMEQGGAFLPLAKEQGFQGKVLVVTAGVSRLEAARLIERGCAGIILKQERPQLLIERIRAMTAAGEPKADSLIFEKIPPSRVDKTRPLTPRERQVLRAIFAGQTSKEIAFTLGVSEPLVKAVIQQLFAKTGVRTRSQLVRAAIERYWKDLEAPEESQV